MNIKSDICKDIAFFVEIILNSMKKVYNVIYKKIIF